MLVRKDVWDKGKASMMSIEDGQDKAHETTIDVHRIGEVLVRLYIESVILDEVKETNVDDQGGTGPRGSL